MVTCQCGLQRLPSLKLDRLRTNGAPCGLRRADGLETCLLRPQQETGPRVVRSRSLLRPAGLWSINGGRPFSFMLALRSSNSCPRIPFAGSVALRGSWGMEQPAPHFVVESRSWSTINPSARHQESSPAPNQVSNSALTKLPSFALSSE